MLGLFFLNFKFCLVLEAGSQVDQAGLESYVAKENHQFLLPPPSSYWDCRSGYHHIHSPSKANITSCLESQEARLTPNLSRSQSPPPKYWVTGHRSLYAFTQCPSVLYQLRDSVSWALSGIFVCLFLFFETRFLCLALAALELSL